MFQVIENQQIKGRIPAHFRLRTVNRMSEKAISAIFRTDLPLPASHKSLQSPARTILTHPGRIMEIQSVSKKHPKRSKVSGSDVFSSRQDIPMEVLFSLEQNLSIMYFCGACDS